MYGAVVSKELGVADNSSFQSPPFVPFEYGSKYVAKVRVGIFAGGVCSLIFSLAMGSVGIIYLLRPTDDKKILGIDEFWRVSLSLITFATVLVGISTFQIISYVKKPFESEKIKRMDLCLLVCTLICGVLFLINGVLFFTMISSVGSSIAKALDEEIVTAYGFEGEATNAIDSLQLKFACCGGSNYEVYEGSRWSAHPSDIVPKVGLVPDSCCVWNESTWQIVDPEACHGDTLTVPNSANLKVCLSAMNQSVTVPSYSFTCKSF
ncbi:unnamed protein product [Dibothriocephalus latus]|uniref:Tetraspanin n=1 Tax=Dibothriocephalus latus TaxID=60516 RepID=A0A3P7NU45_DIBLA|nr:unnamed protein product [Dibothriocephalus latus]